jgi:hypothetical protein
MSSITFQTKTAFVLTWTLTDTQGNAINNASVTATLYTKRSLRDPDAIPGTPVPPIDNLTLDYVAASAGVYSASVPGTLDPATDPGLDGGSFVLVLDGTVSGSPIYHTEQPVVIETAGSDIDLTTVDLVKNRAEVTSDGDDAEIQAAITGFSRWMLNYTGRLSLNSIVALTSELYDGNGNTRLFLRNYPITSLASVVMNGASVPISSGFGSWGVYIEPSMRSIGMRGGMGNFSTFPYPTRWGSGLSSRRGPLFLRGQGNIEVSYSSGYSDVPEDLEYAVRCVVSINYKRKSWQDQKSTAMMAAGTSSTTTYRDWAFPPEYQQVFDNYKRVALI